MGIKDLQGPGPKFKATYGPGSFAKKLKSAAKYGDLKNLAENTETVIKAVKKRETYIRRGGLSRLQKLSAWEDIKKNDKTITAEDKKDIKEILNRLGKNSQIVLKSKVKPVVNKSLRALDTSGISGGLTSDLAERANRIMDKIRGGQRSAGAAGVSGGKASAPGQNLSTVTGFAGNQKRPVSPTTPIAPLNAGRAGRPFIPLQK